MDDTSAANSRILLAIALTVLLAASGCMRNHYRQTADQDAYHVLHEKTWERPWDLPHDYSVYPEPRSRLFDPTNPNDPELPHPGPHLNVYSLPPLRSDSGEAEESAETGAAGDPEVLPPADGAPGTLPEDELPAPTESSRAAGDGAIVPASYSEEADGPPEELNPAAPGILDGPAAEESTEDLGQAPGPQAIYADADQGLTIQPIPKVYWDALPQACLARMLEFQSVRIEYRRTFGTDPPESLRDDSEKLTFENLVELSYLNSREYQSQKELLYTSALALTLERYDYVTKFSAVGNGVDVNYDHVRRNGTTTNFLSTPSSLQGDKMVALGGTLVTRFANDVLLTFNGPQGFAESVSSNLLFEFTQSIFQRDVLLEPLIQSERNVVYAARSFARFRKQFFFDLAQTYYQDLLGTYRQIEIDTQNYFAFVRALDQAEAEVRSGVGNAPPRFQIDQIEQNMLGGRSRLISTCNGLETSLDRFKLRFGLPTEMPINLDLSELETLTRRDELEVAGELIRRARERVVAQLTAANPDREEIVSAAIVLLERVLDWLELRARIEDQELAAAAGLRNLLARMRVDEAYEAVDRSRRRLATTRQPPAVPLNVFRGTMNLVDTRLGLLARQLQLSDALGDNPPARETVLERYIALSGQTQALRTRVAGLLSGESNEDLNALQQEVEGILQELQQLDVTARGMVGAAPDRLETSAELQESMRQVQELVETVDQLASNSEGLAAVDITVDDAMVTALVQRFELMNERGFLADSWRAIKLAADDLKSVLNLNVRQSFQTQNNRPFDFSFDDSRTEVRASFDLPLNRRQQRNAYRRALFNYQQSRRSLMALEDNIKFSARQDLRQLDLDRVQYDISVVSAALASERVYSTQLELALGLATVTARDFLEAQRDYRASLTSVANGRLGYIVNRAQLALDLELMMLDDTGYWPELNDPDYEPNFNPVYPPHAGPTYGELPRGVWPSKKIKRMLYVPLPGYQMAGAPHPLYELGAEE